jgi:hypothetical protein
LGENGFISAGVAGDIYTSSGTAQIMGTPVNNWLQYTFNPSGPTMSYSSSFISPANPLGILIVP